MREYWLDVLELCWRMMPVKLIELTFTVSTNSSVMMLAFRSRSNALSIGLVVSFTNELVFSSLSTTSFPFMSEITDRVMEIRELSNPTKRDSSLLISLRSSTERSITI